MFKFCSNNKAQNLVEFAVILAVIAVVAIVALHFLGKNVNTGYKQSSIKYSNFEPFKFDNPGSTGNSNILPGGSLGGTLTNPVMKCDNGLCSMDNGNYTLTGIPQNFNEFIETSGAAGGVNTISELLQQISAQLAAGGDKTGAEQFQALANMGHFLADNQKFVENMAQQCSTNANPGLCLRNGIADQYPVVPSELTAYLPDYVPGPTSNKNVYHNVLFTNFGNGRYDQVNNNDVFQQSKTNELGYAIVDIYDKIMANPGYSNSMKGVTTELFRQMNDIQFNTALSLNKYNVNNPTILRNVDPITGQILNYVSIPSDVTMDDVLHPKSSVGTNLNSALVCATGWNNDDGSRCH